MSIDLFHSRHVRVRVSTGGLDNINTGSVSCFNIQMSAVKKGLLSPLICILRKRLETF